MRTRDNFIFEHDSVGSGLLLEHRMMNSSSLLSDIVFLLYMHCLYLECTGDLSPFDFFRQETSNPDVIVRTEAMNKILVIVSLMGPERVRNEMLPYLQSKQNRKSH